MNAVNSQNLLEKSIRGGNYWVDLLTKIFVEACSESDFVAIFNNTPDELSSKSVVEDATNTIILKTLNSEPNDIKPLELFQYRLQFNNLMESDGVRRQVLREFQGLLGKIIIHEQDQLFLPIQLFSSKITLITRHPLTRADLKVEIVEVKSTKEEKMQSFFKILFNEVYFHLAQEMCKQYKGDLRSGVMLPKNKLEIWPGMMLDVMEIPGGFSITFDASPKTLFTADTVYDFMNLLQQTFTKEDAKRLFEKFIIGSWVTTEYDGRLHQVTSVAWNLSPLNTFSLKNKWTVESISFKDYLKKKYNVDLKHLTKPLLVCIKNDKKGNSMYGLVPEMCVLTRVQKSECQPKFEKRQTTTEIRIVGPIQPEIRWKALAKFMDTLYSLPAISSLLANWNLAVDKPKCIVNGRKATTMDSLSTKFAMKL